MVRNGRGYVQAVDKRGVGSNAIEGASRKKNLQAVDSFSMGEWRQGCNVPQVRTGCGQMRCFSNAMEGASRKKDLQVVDKSEVLACRQGKKRAESVRELWTNAGACSAHQGAQRP